VQGVVSHGDIVVQSGWIVFRNDTHTLLGEIKEGGAYVLRHRDSRQVPCGEYGVALVPPEAAMQVDTSPSGIHIDSKPDERRYPLRYRVAETSGVRHVVRPGRQVVDIDFAAVP